MKECTKRGLGVVKHATPVSNKMENEMYSKGLLGKDTPDKLLKTGLFLIGVNFALCGGDERKCLRRPVNNCQIVNHVDDNGFECLKFTDYTHSKTNQGGLNIKLSEPKVVYCYRNKDPR